MTPAAGSVGTGTGTADRGDADPAAAWRHADPLGVSQTVMERLQQVGVLARVVEQRLARALGINPTDLAAMEHLMTDGPLTGKDLADRLRVSSAASTHVVDRLERAGHITRRPHASDRRKVLVAAEQASTARAFAFLTPLLRGVEALVAALGEDERTTVERFLGEVVDVYTATADAMAPA